MTEHNDSSQPKKFTIFGQDIDVIMAVFGNILSWFVRCFCPWLLPSLLPTIEEEDTSESPSPSQTKCIAIGRPGGKEQLRIITLKSGYCTAGYNLGKSFVDVSDPKTIPKDTMVVRICSFSINFADCAIRWGLYESANTFVGWPIVPGFDIAGIVEHVSQENQGNFKVGDKVYGATFFGGYSTRVLVPEAQLRKMPSNLSFSQAAAIPAVSLTALYTLHLGGRFPPTKCIPNNSSILIHSAAGGVGSMLVQMSKILGLSPVVGVVGRTSKVDAAKQLKCDIVIDKSKEDLWKMARLASPNGYGIIADANGVSTLKKSFASLAQTGRLIVYGFHSNLPMGNDMLNPIEWMKMIWKMTKMPKFDGKFRLQIPKYGFAFG